MYYSPLRYPGGKGRLAPFMKIIIEKTGHVGGTYIEPFAGGAGISIDLLLNNLVSEIVINDLDKGIYSFWRAVLTETNRFLEDINNATLNMTEWERQHKIYMTQQKRYSYELGFATFYLNRTNRSGIIKGGVIGGRKQTGKWTIEARFHKEHLAERIQEIAKRKRQIHLYNKDINSFLLNYAPQYFDNALIYFDPPYYEKGRELYMNFLQHEDHVRIQSEIGQLENVDWVITYDDCPEIIELYHGYACKRMNWSYSAATKRNVNEIMIFRKTDMIPTETEIQAHKVRTKLRDICDIAQ